MKRILLDTNVYEFILKELEVEHLRKVKERRLIIFYGADIIRKELRSIPKKRKEAVKSKIVKLRSTLLSIYDLLVEKHSYKTGIATKSVADDYYIAYAVLGGKVPKDRIMSDFEIVAVASLHNIDILVSQDSKTMLSRKSIKAFSYVNAINKLKNPNFIRIEEFKRLIDKLVRGVKLD
jgi:hypothetical protein